MVELDPDIQSGRAQPFDYYGPLISCSKGEPRSIILIDLGF